jgi:ubiquinone/menaquinone biosynthesis C-methylase UbiE
VGEDGEVLAVDMSVDALEELRLVSTAANVSYLLGSAEVLPLPDESVDVVIARFEPSNMLDSATTARELYRVLRHGGRASIFEVGSHFDPDEVERLFLEAGFSRVNLELRPGREPYLDATKP